MLVYLKVAVIDHDWSLYVVSGKLQGTCFNDSYCIINDEDVIDEEFWLSAERVCQSVINKRLGERLKAYYD